MKIRPRRFFFFATRAMFALSMMCCGAQPQEKNTATLPNCSSATAIAPKTPVAKVNASVITAEQLDKAAEEHLAQAKEEYQEEIYKIKTQELEILIVERLIEVRAKREGLSPDQLLQREIKARIVEPSDEKIKEVYDATAEKFGGNFPEFEEVESTIKEAVMKQLEENAQKDFIDELMATAEVKILLAPAIPDARDVPTDGPSKGSPNAPVTIVEFADFECPFCGNAQATVDRILETYGGDVRYIYRDFPMPFHRFAAKAAEAAHCAGEQGKYWQMHALLYEHADALSVSDLKTYATDLELDPKQFNSCLDSSKTAPQIKKSLRLIEKLGIRGSPTFFINGRKLSGAQPFERFKEIIDIELKAARRPAK